MKVKVKCVYLLKTVNRHKSLLGDTFLLLGGIKDVFSASGNVCGNLYASKKLRFRMLGSIFSFVTDDSAFLKGKNGFHLC